MTDDLAAQAPTVAEPVPLLTADLARLAEQPELLGGVVVIGNFDGVHLGHRTLLRRMRDLSDGRDLRSIVVTFFPPAKVLFQGSSYLSSAREKIELLSAYAPDAIVTVPFDLTYAQTPKEAFVGQLASLRPSTVIVGEDFRFGHKRAGGLADLEAPGRAVEVFGLVEHAGEPVKSTRIRAHLADGEIASANDLLGAPYRASGAVVEGDRRGRTIGFPTANLDVDPRKALPKGVFAVRARVRGAATADPLPGPPQTREAAANGARSAAPSGWMNGMANVGARPSFPGAPPSLEVHLFDVDLDLYGAELEVVFHVHLRRARTFDGLDDLTAQLERDRSNARAALATV